jgi:hypothetical protein
LTNKTDLLPDKDLFRQSILVLDGLDELMIRDKKDQEEDFLRALLRDMDNYPKLRVLLTSRYQVQTEKFKNDCLILNFSPLTLAQQQDWLEKYRVHHPEAALDAPTLSGFQKHKHLAELCNQAILLYLLAQVHSAAQPIDQNANRATMYKQLFDLLIARKWSDSRQIDALKGLDAATLRTFLQEIAFAIFQSDREYIHKSDLPKLLEQSPTLKNRLPQGSIFIENALKGLMMAFYMQETPKDRSDDDRYDDRSDFGVEFMHKSLQEYLTTEKIWAEMLEITETKRNGDYMAQGWKQCLEILARCFDKRILTGNIKALLIEIIKEADASTRHTLANRLEQFFPKLLDKQFLYQYDVNKDSNPIALCLKTFYGFWTVLAQLEEGRNYIGEENRLGFVEMLKFFSQYAYVANLNLSKINLSGADLRNINFFLANLRGADLSNADLSKANLSGADLSKANLWNVDLWNANLSNVNLSKAHLWNANLIGADFSGVDFSGAKNLFFEQLAESATLYDCKGLDEALELRLRGECPHLFLNPD